MIAAKYQGCLFFGNIDLSVLVSRRRILVQRRSGTWELFRRNPPIGKRHRTKPGVLVPVNAKLLKIEREATTLAFSFLERRIRLQLCVDGPRAGVVTNRSESRRIQNWCGGSSWLKERTTSRPDDARE